MSEHKRQGPIGTLMGVLSAARYDLSMALFVALVAVFLAMVVVILYGIAP